MREHGIPRASLVNRLLIRYTSDRFHNQAENFPQPIVRMCPSFISLSSSLPGHMISPLITARMWNVAVTNHRITNRTVKALQMPLMTVLLKTLPICIAAKVRPALGKTKAHQLSVKRIRRTPARTATVLMQKNQKAKITMKMPRGGC